MSQVKDVNLNKDGFQLKIPSFEILDRGIHLLQGPSGSGKSTLLRVLLGLTDCVGYSWNFKGQELSSLPPEERRIGIVFQNLGLFPHMTARANIEFVTKARGLDPLRAKKNLEEWSDLLKMNSFLDRKVSVLSGGEKQRVAFVRALASDPRIIFLDEPFSSLDKDLKNEGRKILLDIKTKVQVPILMVSHDPEDAEILADKVTKISDGHLIS